MDSPLFTRLHDEGLISDASLSKVEATNQQNYFSLFWELRTLLYLGVLLLTGGLSVLVYKNIDSIGHSVVVAFITLISAGSYYYAIQHGGDFSWKKQHSPNSLFDYIVLLACLSFVCLVGYVQFQYHVFGDRYGMASFVPMVVLFLSAYYFDHIGVLSLAITALCAWAGITVTPTRLLVDNDFNSHSIIWTGIALGVFLTAMAWFSERRSLKSHFSFSWLNFGLHLLFVSLLAGLFTFDNVYLLWFLFLPVAGFYFYKLALQKKSFYLIVMVVLYSYIGLSYVVMRLLFYTFQGDSITLGLMYFVATGAGLIVLLINLNRKIKQS